MNYVSLCSTYTHHSPPPIAPLLCEKESTFCWYQIDPCFRVSAYRSLRASASFELVWEISFRCSGLKGLPVVGELFSFSGSLFFVGGFEERKEICPEFINGGWDRMTPHLQRPITLLLIIILTLKFTLSSVYFLSH